jgi:hypothetical protein
VNDLVRSFWERYLPGRGWANVLVVGGGSTAVLLEERGYDVSTDADAAGPFDAIVCAAPVRPLVRKLRRGGLVITPERMLRKRLLGRLA